MKISHRLVALAAFTSAGLLAVAAVGYFAVTLIQSDLRGLTMHATPLQNKTYEMQERTERALGTLLKLSLATDRAEVEKSVAAVDTELRQLDTLLAQIRELDPKAGGDLSEFKSAREQIATTANKRLADDAAYRSETESARTALKQAEVDSVQRLEVEAGREDVLKEVRAAVSAIFEAFNKDGTGLFALRAEVLSGKMESEDAYQKQRRAILGPIEELSQKLA